jgi:hypothetical protein
MMKTLYVLPLLVASGLYAAPEASALTLDNGRTLNGRTLNGGSLNGRTLNGRTLNGLSFNGRTINGRNVNGVALHGTAETAGAVKAVTVILQDGERVTLK